MSARSPSPPTSPRISTSRLSLYNISQALIRMKRLKNVKQIESTSGSDPITQLSGPVSTVQVPIRRNDEFVCAFGVDLLKLIRACRSTLFEQAKTIGANVLIDEQWNASITFPKNPEDRYKVQVQYSAKATWSDTESDPGKPVAPDLAVGVPGLMTVVKRSQ